MRGATARYGTWRALAWSVFIAVAFFTLSNPTHLVRDFPGAMGALAVATGVVLLLDRRNLRFPRMPWSVVVYLGLAAVSVTWSIERSDTVLMTILYAWVALLACICVAQTDNQTLLRGVAWSGVLLTTVTLISVVVDPERFGGGLLFPGSGPGVHGSRGVVAYSLVLALCAALSRRDARPLRRIEIGVTIALNLAVVVIAPSATGQVAVPVVFGTLLALTVLRRLNGRALTLARISIALGVVLALVISVLNASRITALLGRSPDLSGRFAAWQAILPAWLAAPVGGYGFGAVWNYGWWRLDGSPVLDQMSKVAGFEFYHGHNNFLDVLPQLGALGFIAALLILGLLGVRGIRALRDQPEAGMWAILTLVTLLVMGVTEPMLSVPVGWFCAVATTACCRHGRGRLSGRISDPRQAG